MWGHVKFYKGYLERKDSIGICKRNLVDDNDRESGKWQGSPRKILR